MFIYIHLEKLIGVIQIFIYNCKGIPRSIGNPTMLENIQSPIIVDIQYTDASSFCSTIQISQIFQCSRSFIRCQLINISFKRISPVTIGTSLNSNHPRTIRKFLAINRAVSSQTKIIVLIGQQRYVFPLS